jgi:hypothetical protein
MAEESFASQPEQNSGILSDAPKHGEIVEVVVRLAQDVNALVF